MKWTKKNWSFLAVDVVTKGRTASSRVTVNIASRIKLYLIFDLMINVTLALHLAA